MTDRGFARGKLVRRYGPVQLAAVIAAVFMALITLTAADDWPMRGHDSQHMGATTGGPGGDLELAWSFTPSGNVFSSPAVVDGVVYIGSGDDKVYAFDAGNGETLWSYTTGSHVFSSPAVARDTVYVGSFDNNVYALDENTGKKT